MAVSDFPFDVDTTDHTWITLADGARLSARLRRPVHDEPVPAILEYLPYRKDDGTLARDSRQHDYLAGHGFACIRVDIRGSGNSDGILRGEYLETELSDGVEVIEWIASQSWCNGQVAMMGISWGGFNCLQIAARRPPALAAIVSVAATVDRYATDVHYKGGTVLGTDMLPWAATMLCFNARAPSAQVLGDEWRRRWLERVEETPVYIDDWLEHQRRDEFWKHGSVCEDFSAIRCPVLTVGGYADGYTDTVFHLVEHLAVPVRGIVGPWSHNYPAVGVPGPNIGFLQEVLDWLGEHLDAPHEVQLDRREWSDPLRIWVQEWVAPTNNYPERPGRWISEPSWPSPHISARTMYLGDVIMTDEPLRRHTKTAGNDLLVGLRQGGWWGYAQPGQLPADQREEEPAAFRFLSEPVVDQVTIVGFPQLELRLSVDQPVAMIAVRLCDVAPDGSSLQLSRGLLNLTHRESHEEPSELDPGAEYDVTVTLDSMAHDVAQGHRIEVLVSTSLWPLAWPSPGACELTLHLGERCRLVLPVRGATGDEIADVTHPPWFEPPETASAGTTTVVPASHRREIDEDAATGATRLTDHADEGTVRFDRSGNEMSSSATDSWFITRGEPLSARVVSERTWSLQASDLSTEIATRSEMWCDHNNFYTTCTVRLTENGVEVLTKEHTASHRRDLV